MDATRRDVVKGLGGTALAVGAVPLLLASRASGPATDLRAPGGTGLEPRLADALHHASLAPSGHNAQPWAVQVSGPGRLRLGTARERWLPAVDPENRETLLSLGCFLENFAVAARAHGLDPDVWVAGTSASDPEILEVALREVRPQPFPLERIRRRRTVRGDHLPRELTREDVRTLTAPFAGLAAYFPAGSTAARWLAGATIEANRAQASRDPAQEELSRWIRWSDDEARRHRDGLTPDSMEITGVAGWYVRHFMSPESVQAQGFRERGVETVRRQLRSYGGWLVVTSPDASVSSLLDTGRQLQRMLLGVRERRIAVHPMSQALEESPIKEEVAPTLGLSGRVQLLLRVGYVERYPEPVSPRRPVTRFVSVLQGTGSAAPELS